MTLHHGDCLDVMAGMEPESVDAVVTDPPYGLSFMGKAWDDLTKVPEHTGPQWGGYGWHGSGSIDPNKSQVFHYRWAEAAYRVAKPSAYLLAFGGTRTVHRMTVALEDAGWIIRDMLVWGYASGFPKSKASLKPAWEPIVMARKPGPLRMLAIDECRIGYEPDDLAARTARTGAHAGEAYGHRGTVPYSGGEVAPPNSSGRWPANIVLTDPIFDGGIEGVVGGGQAAPGGNINGRPVTGYSKGWADERWFEGYQDSGTYSRFFLIPKADRSDREPVLGGLSGLEVDGRELAFDTFNENVGNTMASRRRNSHPTVKPTDLMRHLVRLVTPAQVPIGTCDRCGTVVDYPYGQDSSSTATMRDMRGSDMDGSPDEDEVLRSSMRGQTYGSQSLELPWLDQEPGGLHPREGSRSSDGESRGLSDAASSGGSGDAGADAPAVRGRRSHQRSEGRQPAREPSGHGQAGARQPSEAAEEADQVSALWRHHHSVGSDSACDGRLIPGVRPGRVLDPFLGSGTTALAAEMEGFPWIGIEREAEYIAICEARLNGVQKGLGLSA